MAHYPSSYIGKDGTEYSLHTTSHKVNPELIRIYTYIETEHVLTAQQPFDMSSFGMPNEAKFNLKYNQCLERDNKKYVILGNYATMPVESSKYDDAYIIIQKHTPIKVNNMDITLDEPVRIKTGAWI